MFDIINDILSAKKGDSLRREDFNSEFNLYMIQRWLSIHSDFNVDFLNRTVNSLYKTLDNEEHFKLMMMIIPRCKTRRKYIKSGKNSKKVSKDDINLGDFFEESSEKINESLKIVLGDMNE